MTTLSSEEITLSSDSVDQGGISAFECQWQHWTVKRSLCPLLTLTRWAWGGYICLWVSMTTLNSKEITLSSDSVECGEAISAFACQCEQWWDHSDSVECGEGVYLPFSVNDNIEQWRDHSVHCYCWPSGGYICLWVSMTTLNSKEITLFSTVDLGGNLPLSVNDNIEQEITLSSDSVEWGGYICLWVSMTTLNSKEITLSYDSVEWGISAFESQWSTLNSEKITLSSDSVDPVGGISAFESQWQHWTVKRSLCPLPLSVNDNIEQWRDHSVLC